jgi:hypothetical protein
MRPYPFKEPQAPAGVPSAQCSAQMHPWWQTGMLGAR